MDREKKTFPRELLLQSKKERFEYFENKVFGHDRLLKMDDQLLHALLYPIGASIILVFGPTGVGKTTLRTRIERKLLELEMEAMQWDPGYLPVVSMEAIATSRSYDWKEHIIRTLIAAKEPLIDHKVNPDARKVSRGKELTRSPDGTELALRRSLESCVHERRTKYIIVDEAQHLNKVGRERNHRDQMETIKSLAETTGTIYVLIGTYDLLELTHLSAQLCRRSINIHFSRYNNHVEDDQNAFASMLETFQQHLPLGQTPDLLGFEDYLYEKTFGCIGVLKTMLNNALSKALSSEDETMTMEILEESAPPLRDLVRMSQEIAEGEGVLRETDEQLIKVRNFLAERPPERRKEEKEKKVADVQKPPEDEAKPEQVDGQPSEEPSVKPRQRRPGERLPKREKAGRSKKVG